MGMIDREPPVADVIGLRSYIVDTVIRRDLGSGIASIINCRTLGGVIVPQCEIIIAAHHLIQIGRDAGDFATEMFNRHHAAMMKVAGSRH